MNGWISTCHAWVTVKTLLVENLDEQKERIKRNMDGVFLYDMVFAVADGIFVIFNWCNVEVVSSDTILKCSVNFVIAC